MGSSTIPNNKFIKPVPTKGSHLWERCEWKQQEEFACNVESPYSYSTGTFLPYHDVLGEPLRNAADRTHSNSSSSSTGSRQSLQPSKCRYILIPFLIHNTLRLCISSNMQLIYFIEKLYF